MSASPGARGRRAAWSVWVADELQPPGTPPSSTPPGTNVLMFAGPTLFLVFFARCYDSLDIPLQLAVKGFLVYQTRLWPPPRVLFRQVVHNGAPTMVIDTTMERRRNEGGEEMGDPLENPPTSGIVRQDSHKRKYGPRNSPVAQAPLGMFSATIDGPLYHTPSTLQPRSSKGIVPPGAAEPTSLETPEDHFGQPCPDCRESQRQLASTSARNNRPFFQARSPEHDGFKEEVVNTCSPEQGISSELPLPPPPRQKHPINTVFHHITLLRPPHTNRSRSSPRSHSQKPKLALTSHQRRRM
ncbi:hypothetical protein PR048_025800 [Dryococelus australis]|uniref:Uncharacterized protein n=1 Tax=Dryococelus australis TaxID=614101 RepID=A0ABQ9GJL4_9NEOP|nr:hypothetical protein PR048_025800 [Dryococelus australis]